MRSFAAVAVLGLVASTSAAPLLKYSLQKRNALCTPQPDFGVQIRSADVDTRAGWVPDSSDGVSFGNINLQDFGTMNPSPNNSHFSYNITGNGRGTYSISWDQASGVCVGVDDVSESNELVSLACSDTSGRNEWFLQCLGADERCEGAISNCIIQSAYTGRCATISGPSNTNITLSACEGLNATTSNQAQLFNFE